MLDTPSCTLLRVLINHYHPHDVEHFCRYLPTDTAQAVLATNIEMTDLSFAWQTPYLWLERMHYSWLAPAIAAFPSAWQAPLAAALAPQQRGHLRHMLQLAKSHLPTPPARKYLQQLLFDKLQLQAVTPLVLVPDSPFKVLCQWDKKRLVELIDYLSMHDLKEKIRHIVDRKRLRDVYAILSKGRFEFLRSIMQQKEKITTGALPLDAWQGDRQGLQRLLHHRGLLRLGTALCGQSEALVWHLTHALDTGRSAIIMRCYQASATQPIIQLLGQQVIALIQYLEDGEQRGEK